jgi:hypothetical protein
VYFYLWNGMFVNENRFWPMGVQLAERIGRAFSPLIPRVIRFPGALPLAGMGRGLAHDEGLPMDLDLPPSWG